MRRRLNPARLDARALDRLFTPLLGMRRVGLAVSGGPDSMGLMLLADRWRRGRPEAPEFIVYSVDHGLRPEAAVEAAMVTDIADRLGLAARILTWQGPKPAAGLQSAARAARYRLIGAAMAEDGAELLVTAHHGRDQAETVLMRLAHGSGLEGLAGMAERERVFGIDIFRPLLGTDPAVLAAEVAAAALTPADDPSNRDPAYERVRWRAVLPALAELGLDADTIGAFARRAGEAANALDLWAGRAVGDIVTRHPLGALRIDRHGFTALPQPVAIRVFATALRRAGGAEGRHALGSLERAIERLRSGAEAGFTVGGCLVRPRGREIWISREPGRIRPDPLTLAPDSRLVWDDRFTIRNASPDAAFTVAPALGLTREEAERALGCRLDLPVAAIRAAPLVTTPGGSVAALGEHALDARVEVREI